MSIRRWITRRAVRDAATATLAAWVMVAATLAIGPGPAAAQATPAPGPPIDVRTPVAGDHSTNPTTLHWQIQALSPVRVDTSIGVQIIQDLLITYAADNTSPGDPSLLVDNAGNFGGEFNIPKAALLAAIDTTTAAGADLVSFYCETSDITIAGDCGLPFQLGPPAINTTDAANLLTPGETVRGFARVVLLGFTSAPDVSKVRTYLRDRLDANRLIEPCFKNAVTPNQLPGYSCTPPLNLELLPPGSPAPPPATEDVTEKQGTVDPGNSASCDVTTDESTQSTAVTLASIQVSDGVGVEKSTSSNHTFELVEYADRGLGFNFSFGATAKTGTTESAGSLSASGMLTFKHGWIMEFDHAADADQVSQYFDGKLATTTASTAADLARESLASTYSETGVDLNGELSRGPASGSLEYVEGIGAAKSRTGRYTQYSTTKLAASGGADLGILSLDPGGDVTHVIASTLGADDQPSLLTLETDVGVTASLSLSDGPDVPKLAKAIGSVESKISTGGAAGLRVIISTSLDLSSGPNRQLAAKLLSEMAGNGSPDQLANDLAAFTSQSATRVLLLGTESVSGGFGAQTGDGLTYGLKFGTNGTHSHVIAAFKKDAGDSTLSNWTDCKP